MTHTGRVIEGLVCRGEGPALVCAGRTLSGVDVLAHIYRTARMFQAQGFGRGSCLAMLTGNRPEAITLRHAANLLGGRVALLYTERSVSDLVAMAQRVGPDVFVFDPVRFGSQGRHVAAGLPAALVFTLGSTDTGEDVAEVAGMMAEYWADPRASADAFCDGWFRTRDRGYRDHDGVLRVLGRADGAVLVNAHNVYPRDVEEPLLAHPDVRHAVMFGITGPDHQQVVHAAVVVAEHATVTPEQLQDWVDTRQGPLFVPRSIVLVPSISLNETGKPDLAALRSRVAVDWADAPDGRP